MGYSAVVIGVSAGGHQALKTILPQFPENFPPVLIVQHIHRHMDDAQIEFLGDRCSQKVRFAEDKLPLEKDMILFAPANYHMLVEMDRTISLSTDPPVNHARPAIDVLFETAAEAFGRELIGLVLTGASSDGSRGLKCVAESGGLSIVQSPDTAEMTMMPKSALTAVDVDFVLPLQDIAPLLIRQIHPSLPVSAPIRSVNP